MNTVSSLMSIAGGFVLLLLGAEGLVRGSAALALRAGLTPLVIGLTVVALGTSSPELVVSVQAASAGQGPLSIGNVVGSNIANIALILGLSALIRPLRIHAQVLRLDLPVMIGCTLLLIAFLWDGRLLRWEGAVLAAGLIAYVTFNVVQARKERGGLSEKDLEAVLPVRRTHLAVDLVFVAVGLALLAFGSDLLVSGAVAMAKRLGWSEAVIGLTIVAIGTSLPELAASTVAALKKEGDIAVGNVVGSNVFNVLGILGLATLVSPMTTGGIRPFDLGAMLFFAVLLLPLMRTGFCLTRVEGALLLAGYGVYVYLLLP